MLAARDQHIYNPILLISRWEVVDRPRVSVVKQALWLVESSRMTWNSQSESSFQHSIVYDIDSKFVITQKYLSQMLFSMTTYYPLHSPCSQPWAPPSGFPVRTVGASLSVCRPWPPSENNISTHICGRLRMSTIWTSLLDQFRYSWNQFPALAMALNVFAKIYGFEKKKVQLVHFIKK